MQPFATEFPKETFSCFTAQERESNCVAYVEIIFSNSEIAEWKMATTAGQMKRFADGEVFGYPVESGMGRFMDVDTQNSLNELGAEIIQK
jgi:hypothetical protein